MTDLKVEFEDSRIERLCTDEAWARRKRGDVADKIKLRVNAVVNALTLADLVTNDPLGSWHVLGAQFPRCWSGKLSANYRLLLRPSTEDSEPENIDAVTITQVIDYH